MKLLHPLGLLATQLLLLTYVALPTSAQLPASKGAPQVGEKVPDFTLPDSNGKDVRLSDLLADPSAAPKRSAKGAPALLLVFYRGYW